jgi:hypothetical protein
MTLAKRFVKALINELKEGVWELRITYSYYSLFEFEERFICNSLEEAKNKLLTERCPDILVIDRNAKVLKL